ncbi:MAG: VWA domain-containing protein, partial [Verrucomicrobiaceae bacterium]
TDSFTQGHSGVAAVQSFSVSEAGIFDLLIVIDNSSSMGPYQNRLSRTLPDILKHIQNTNWRIGVVTTSTACLRKTDLGQAYITRQDFDRNSAQADADFQKLIKVGETGNPVERGILMATHAMQETGCDAGNVAWLRPDSQRAVLLLTDENNCGSAPNEGCAGQPHEKAEYFFDRVGKKVVFNAMVLTQEPPSSSLDPNYRECENSGGYGIGVERHLWRNEPRRRRGRRGRAEEQPHAGGGDEPPRRQARQRR